MPVWGHIKIDLDFFSFEHILYIINIFLLHGTVY